MDERERIYAREDEAVSLAEGFEDEEAGRSQQATSPVAILSKSNPIGRKILANAISRDRVLSGNEGLSPVLSSGGLLAFAPPPDPELLEDIHPGAYPVSPHPDSEEESSTQDITLTSQEENLVEATLVEEAKQIIEAEMIPPLLRRKSTWLLVLLAVVVITSVAVGVWQAGHLEPPPLLQSKGTNMSTPTRPPPAAVVDEFRRSLPNGTQISVSNSESPQARAYRWLLSDPSFTEYPAERLRHRFSLATLFFATQGQDWNRKSGWLNMSLHECDWSFDELDGPTCDNSDAFKHVAFIENNLAGSLPDEIGLLSTLTSFVIMSNQKLSGVIPSGIQDLSSLTSLVVCNTKVSGSLPTSLLGMQLVRLINLALNALSGTIPSELGQLSRLEIFNLTSNYFSGTLPEELASWSMLKTMALGTNWLKGTIPSSYQQLTSMLKVDWSNNFLTGFLPLETLSAWNKTLTSLDLSNNSLNGTLSSDIGYLTHLTHLGLTEVLGFYNENLPTELGLLTQLQTLLLGTNGFSGTVPSVLGNLTKLEYLVLDGNNLSGSIPHELCILIEPFATTGLKIFMDCISSEGGLGSLTCDCGCICLRLDDDLCYNYNNNPYICH